MTTLALFMLVVAVQVSSGSASEWVFIGLDLIELGYETSQSLPSILDVALHISDDISQVVLAIINCLVDQLLNSLNRG